MQLAWDKWKHGLLFAVAVGAAGEILEVLQHAQTSGVFEWKGLAYGAWASGLAAGLAWIKIQPPPITVETTTTTIKEVTPTTVVKTEVKETEKVSEAPKKEV